MSKFPLPRAATGLNKAAVMVTLWQNAQNAMQAVPVLNARGEPTGEYRYDGNVVNRACELLGREMGMFIEQQETTLKIEDKIRW